MTTKLILAIAAIYGFIGVVANSLSSHTIRPQLEAKGKLASFNIAADFMLYHGIALLVLGALIHQFPKAGFQWTAYAFIVGSVFFQGSVFLKSFIEIGAWGIVTPIGGMILMIGWLLLAVWAFRI